MPNIFLDKVFFLTAIFTFKWLDITHYFWNMLCECNLLKISTTIKSYRSCFYLQNCILKVVDNFSLISRYGKAKSHE